ncbi:MAG: penicillin-binding protein [Lawsonibacter sp.]|nr:penicillin-binding protein [Lawsonibacter sp.]
MSDYRNYNNYKHSLYDDSDYPSRRQPPSRERQSGGSSGGGGGAPRKRRKKKKRGGVGRVIGAFFKVLGTLILIGLCTGALMACFAAVYINEVIVPQADLSMDDFPLGENSVMYYEDKETGQYKEMTTLLNVTSSVWVDFEEMPLNLINAAVAIEDKRFWTHPGVDWRGTAKAVLSMFTGGEVSGGSTITQQLIKNETQYNETTVKRKVTEIIRALRFTQNNSKEDTLERYLNIIPLGSGCKGVGAAALEYFGKPVSQLTLAECASLVGITNNPSKYGPYSFNRSQGVNTEEIWDARQWNKYRQEVILWQMLEQGMITRAEYDQAVTQELNFVRAQGEGNSDQIYTWYEETVISDVRQALQDNFGWSDERTDQIMQSGGLRIYTCYDPEAQAIAEEIYTDRANLNYTSKDGQQMQSAICVINNETGDVAAIVGQFGDKTVNRGSNYANAGHRQPGSSFKPLSVYSPALEFGRINPYTVLDDYPYDTRTGSAWPKNSGTTHYRGLVPVFEALKRSLNTAAVRIMSDYINPEESFKFVEERYHIELEPGRMVYGEWKTDIDVAPMAMGGLTNGVNVRDMAEAFATFPNGGMYKRSRTFTRVTQLVNGQEVTLLENNTVSEPAIKATTAYYMNTMLQGVFADGGTGASQGGIKGQHAAGKTGTTSENFDRWFVGYTPYYTAAVWTGYERNVKIVAKNNPALALWKQVMTKLHEDLPDKDYPCPESMRTINYCRDSGLLANEWCKLDPRGNRTASGSVFPEDYPENKPCTVHTAESTVTVCLDCPVLKADGSPSSLYHQAGPYCPEDRQQQVCYPNYQREQVGNASADDGLWRYETASAYGQCTVHTEPPVTEPDPPEVTDPTNPTNPTNPPNPTNPTDPNGPWNNWGEPSNPGTTDPGPVQNPTPEDQPDVPIFPLDPNNSMVG